METKKCPYCSEVILKEARKCKYCGEFLDQYLKNERRRERESETPREIKVTQKSSSLVTFLIILAIIVLIGWITGI